MKKEKYIFSNLLVNRFNVSTIDKIWSIDDTKLPFSDKDQKLSILFVIDLGSRKVIKFLLTKKDFNASHIKRAVKNVMIARNIKEHDDPKNRLIVHSDRDTHFCSKTWLSLQQEEEKKVRLSMSSQGSPTENAVSKRFHRTIKNIFIETPVKEYKNKKLTSFLAETNSKKFSTKELKQIVKLYVDFYNNQSTHSSIQSTPNFLDNVCQETIDLVVEPEVIAVRNNDTSPIEDRIAVSEHKKNILNIYEQAQLLLNDNDVSENNRVLKKKIQRIVQHENKKLASLT